MKRVLVTTPSKSGVPPHWVAFMESVLRNQIPGFEVDFAIESDQQAINLSRNIMAYWAMAAEYDVNVQVDADHPLDRSHLERLLSHQEPVVSGLYAKKVPKMVKWVGLRAKGAELRPDGLLEASHLPTGFLKIDVAVYRRLAEVFPERRYANTTDSGKDIECYEFFPIGLVGPNTPEAKLAKLHSLMHPARDTRFIPTGVQLADMVSVILEQHPEPARLLGEDYFFSHLCRKAGFKLYLDTRCQILHMGSAPFPPPEDWMPTKAEPIPEAKVDLSQY